MARAQKRSIPDLYLYLGESLAHLERYSEAEAQYREELRTFPRSVHVYSRLAMLYAATNRQEAVEDVLNELVAATPTPESYAVAARLWTIVGNRLARGSAQIGRADPFPGGSVSGAPWEGWAAIRIRPTPTQKMLRTFLTRARVTPVAAGHPSSAAIPPAARFVDPEPERNELEHDDHGAIERAEYDRLGDRRSASGSSHRSVRNTSSTATA